MEDIEKKFNSLVDLYTSLYKTIQNIVKKNERFNDTFFKSLNDSLEEIQKVINVNLKNFLVDKSKLYCETEANLDNIVATYLQSYEKFIKNFKEFETKVNNVINIIKDEETAAKQAALVPPTQIVEANTKQAALVSPTQNVEANINQTPQSLDNLKVVSKPTTKSVFSHFSPSGISPHALTKYKELINHYKNSQIEFDSIFNEPQLKSYKNDLQQAINFTLNSLLEDENQSNNKRNFEDKIKTLLRLFNGDTCVITSILTVNPKRHPKGLIHFFIFLKLAESFLKNLAIEFCLNYLARKIVEKGENTVESRPKTAFQYAQLAMIIVNQHPIFKNILIGHFFDKCPYVVPYHKPKPQNQSIEDYLQ